MYDEDSNEPNLNRATKYTNMTGLCPVCRSRPSGHGITCGDWGCMNHWLPGGDKTIPINKSVSLNS